MGLFRDRFRSALFFSFCFFLFVSTLACEVAIPALLNHSRSSTARLLIITLAIEALFSTLSLSHKFWLPSSDSFCRSSEVRHPSSPLHRQSTRVNYLLLRIRSHFEFLLPSCIREIQRHKMHDLPPQHKFIAMYVRGCQRVIFGPIDVDFFPFIFVIAL